MNSIDIVTLCDVIDAIGRESVDDILAHARHRIDECGTIYWIADELVELIELVEHERQTRGLSADSSRATALGIPLDSGEPTRPKSLKTPT